MMTNRNGERFRCWRSNLSFPRRSRKPSRRRIRVPWALALLPGLATWPAAAPAQTTEAAEVDRIREAYASVQREIGSYRRVERPYPGRVAIDEMVVGFYRAGELGMIRARYYTEGRGRVEEYYIEKGRLFFLARSLDPRDGECDCPENAREEERLYFSGGRLIRWVDDNGYLLETERPAARDAQREALERLQFLVGIVR